MKDCGLYIGFSADLKRRMSEHEAALSRSTAHRLPVVLAYYEAYRCRPDAEGRERFLKSGSGRTFLKKQMRYFFEEHPLRVGQGLAECPRAANSAFFTGLLPANFRRIENRNLEMLDHRIAGDQEPGLHRGPIVARREPVHFVEFV